MRTWLLVGSLAAGVLVYIYEYYKARESHQRERPHGADSGYSDDDDYVTINETVPKKTESRRNTAKLPSKDETCSVCLDKLVYNLVKSKYCIIKIPCGHWFHQACAMRLLEYSTKCPVCRATIDMSVLRQNPVHILPNSVSSTIRSSSKGRSTDELQLIPSKVNKNK